MDYEFVKHAEYITQPGSTCNLTFIFFLIIAIIILFLFFKWLFVSGTDNNEHLTINCSDNDLSGTNVIVNIEKYIPDYWGLPNRGNLWYNQYTPFIWNNSGKVPSHMFPYYARVHDYYQSGYPYLYY